MTFPLSVLSVWTLMAMTIGAAIVYTTETMINKWRYRRVLEKYDQAITAWGRQGRAPSLKQLLDEYGEGGLPNVETPPEPIEARIRECISGILATTDGADAGAVLHPIDPEWHQVNRRTETPATERFR